VSQSSKFDLQAAFSGLCPLAENFQNQIGPIKDFNSDGFFDVALLRGR